MAIKLDDITLTEDDSLLKEKGFSVVVNVLTKLHREKILERMSRNCIAASEIVGTLLYQRGIKSYVLECQATVDSPTTGYLDLVGYDSMFSLDFPEDEQVDTHTVLIVLLEDTQLLIDVSISYALPDSHPYVVQRVNGTSPEVIAESKFEDVSVVYTSKKNNRLPHIYQSNLLSSILGEYKNHKRIIALTRNVNIGLVVGGVNFILLILLVFRKILL